MKWKEFKRFVDSHFDDDEEIFFTAGFSMCEIGRISHGCEIFKVNTRDGGIECVSFDEISRIYRDENKEQAKAFLDYIDKEL